MDQVCVVVAVFDEDHHGACLLAEAVVQFSLRIHGNS
jgi:hypothetical protein